MTTYDFFAISVREGKEPDIYLWCTDASTLDWAANLLTQHGCTNITNKVHHRYGQDSLDKKNIPNLRRMIHNCGYNQWSLSWWLIQQLCQSGWEPFGTTTVDDASAGLDRRLRVNLRRVNN